MQMKYKEKEGRGGSKRIGMSIYRHCESRIKSTEWTDWAVGEARKRKGNN